MFSYSGPRHVKVFGLWDEQALYAATYQDMLKGCVGAAHHLHLHTYIVAGARGRAQRFWPPPGGSFAPAPSPPPTRAETATAYAAARARARVPPPHSPRRLPAACLATGRCCCAVRSVHIIVGTPEYVSRVAVGGKLPLHHLRGIVVDEADACFADTPSGADAPADGPAERTTNADAMAGLLRRMRETRESAPGGGGAVPPPQTILAGASLTPALVQRALRYGWVREPALVSERGWIDNGAQLEAIASFDEGVARGGGRGGGLAAGGVSGAAAGWTEQRVPAGHSHRYVVVKPSDAVAVLCRLLRARFEAANSETEPPRVVVFAPSAEAAVRLASQLQGALFGTLSGDASAGLWGLSVLLPSAEARLDTTTSGARCAPRCVRMGAHACLVPCPCVGGCVWMCVGACGCVWVRVGACGCVWVCVGASCVWTCARVWCATHAHASAPASLHASAPASLHASLHASAHASAHASLHASLHASASGHACAYAHMRARARA